MASRGKSPEVIDLTEPEIIGLDSDGEAVTSSQQPMNGTAPTSASQTDGAGMPGQAKKKRKKRKRKSTGNSAGAQASPEEQLADASSAEASRPHSRTDTTAIELETEMDKAETANASGSGAGANAASGKKSLKDRLSGLSQEEVRGEGDGQKRRQERRRKDRRREMEQERAQEKQRERDGQRERDRRRSMSPRRDRDRKRDRDGERTRRRSRSREREREREPERDRDKRKRDEAPESDAQLFFEDLTPAEVPGAVKLPESVAALSGPSTQVGTSANPRVDAPIQDGLLLPAHVSVAQGEETSDMTPLKVPTPEGSDDDEDYIEYLDYDDDRRAGMVRYWELEKFEAEEARASKPTKFVCKKCGAEGEHRTYECPVLICLTCGARDEHSTRSCPISKVCFTCGMKGHINKTCPNRGKHGAYHSSHDCDRCGARTHQTNECPTLWRIYKYVEDEVRQEILRVREGKSVLALGQGGEGYIATDEWCYNCGECGHLGDDCTGVPHQFDTPNESSAFSLYNILSGPFASEASRPSKRAPRDWEAATAFADGFGSTMPMEVGRQGRRKERERQERKAREREDAEDDQEDWFSRARSDGKDSRGAGRNSHGGGPKANGKIKFDLSTSSLGSGDRKRDGKRQRTSYDDDLPGPSRETDSIQIRGAARKQSYRSTSSKDRYDRYDRERDRGSQRGPRYRGDYSR